MIPNNDPENRTGLPRAVAYPWAPQAPDATASTSRPGPRPHSRSSSNRESLLTSAVLLARLRLSGRPGRTET